MERMELFNETRHSSKMVNAKCYSMLGCAMETDVYVRTDRLAFHGEGGFASCLTLRWSMRGTFLE